MAVNNWGDYSKAPILASPWKTAFEDVLSGYKMQQEPGKMAQEKEKRGLANKLSQLENEHKPKEYELNDKQKSLANALSSKALEHYEEKYGLEKRLKEAQINKANQPAGLKGALANAFQLRDTLDKKSPTYQKDLGAVNSYINKLGTSSNGVQVSGSPGGSFEISVGGSSKDQQANIQGLPPLPKGQVWLYDEQGEVKGRGEPYKEAEKKEEGGRAAFNIYQKFITDAQSPYSGRDSNARFQSDVDNYETDPAAKDRIDKLLAADNLLFSATVKEEATLGGANTNQAYNRITHSLKTSEIYPLLQTAAQYQLPPGYAKASKDIFNTVLNQGTEAGHKIPAFKAYYTKTGDKINSPEQAAQSKALSKGKMAKENPEIIEMRNGFATIKNEGKTFRIPEALVDKYMIEHSQSELGGRYGK